MIQAKDISVSFRKENQKKLFGKERCQVLFDVSFHVNEGQCLGILGESGSGKSTLGKVLCGLLKPDHGNVIIDKVAIYDKNFKKKKPVMSIVFQDYTTSANPRFRVKDLIGESIRIHYKRESKQGDFLQEIKTLLELVGLGERHLERYPHELSGGQLQRVCIARALAVNPKMILFDEAINSLDSHTQVQIMDLLKDIQKKRRITYIFVTHDLTSVTYLCDEVLFLYEGKIVEHRQVLDIANVENDYARKLLYSVMDF